MPRCLALVFLIFLLDGCAWLNSRAPGPISTRTTTSVDISTRPIAAPTTPRSPLIINTPLPAFPPGSSDQVQVVPVVPAQFPTSQASVGVVPAGGQLPTDEGQALASNEAGLDRRRLLRREPRPGDLPSPLAPSLPSQEPTQPAPMPGVPAPPPQEAGFVAIKRLLQTAIDKWKTVDTYEARLTRREAVGDAAPATEEVIVQFRKEPFAVYMRNVGETGRGREVLYNPSKFEDKIHVVVGEGDSRLFRAGSRPPPISPDSSLVTGKSRHSIRQAGCGTPINAFARHVAAIEAGNRPAETLRYVGRVTRQEFDDMPLESVEQTLRPGDDPLLPRGGVRHWFFCAGPKSPAYGLPVLAILYENTPRQPREVEYYCLTQVRLPAGLIDADFDVARLGKKP